MALAAWAIAALIQRATGRLDRRRRRGGAADAQSGRALPAEHADERAAAVRHDVPRDRARSRDGRRTSRRDRPPKPRFRRAERRQWRPGWALVAACLTRYEAWPIAAAAIVLAGVVLLKRGWRFMDALRAIRGLALWPLWTLAAFLVNSKVTVGSWFVSTGFFIAENNGARTSAAGMASSLGWPGPPDGTRTALARMCLGDRNRLDVRAIAIARGTHRHAGTRGRRGAAAGTPT